MDLTRFHTAQTGTYDSALAELRAGRKLSHWMWYIFPQHEGLGRSSTAKHYGLQGLPEAQAYLADKTLAERLTQVTKAVLTHPNKTAEQILGPVDALKLRSSATLFREAGGGPEFQTILDTFYDGPCPLTLGLIEKDKQNQ